MLRAGALLVPPLTSSGCCSVRRGSSEGRRSTFRRGDGRHIQSIWWRGKEAAWPPQGRRRGAPLASESEGLLHGLHEVRRSSLARRTTITFSHTLLIVTSTRLCRKFSLKRPVQCSTCDGTGGKSKMQNTCQNCQGSGIETVMRQVGPGMITQMQRKCSKCGGKGKSIRPGPHTRPKPLFVEHASVLFTTLVHPSEFWSPSVGIMGYRVDASARVQQHAA